MFCRDFFLRIMNYLGSETDISDFWGFDNTVTGTSWHDQRDSGKFFASKVRPLNVE